MIKEIKFAFQFLSGRWIQLTLAIITICSSGGASIFSSYSQYLKEKLGYDQMTVNSLSSCKEVGTFMGNIVFSMLNILPTWLNIFLGAVGNVWGYYNIWRGVVDQRPPTWNLKLLLLLGSASQQVLISAASSTLSHFPQSKHTGKTIVKGLEIMSGTILIHTYTSIFGEDQEMLLPYLAFLPTAICSVTFLFFQKINPKTHEDDEESIMLTTLRRSACVAGSLLLMTICRMNLVFPMVALIADGACVCALLAFAIKGLVHQQVRTWREVEFTVVSDEEKPSLWDKLSSVFTSNSLIIFTAALMSTGSTSSFTNNIGQLSRSLSYHKKKTQNIVALLGILKFFGLMVGHVFINIPLLKRAQYKIKSVMLTVIICAVGYLVLALKGKEYFYLSASVDAVTSGFEAHLLQSLISDLFEIPVEGVIFPVAQLGAVAGNFVLSGIMASLYDREAKKQVGSRGLGGGSMIRCDGIDCYKLSLLALALLKVLSIIPYSRILKRLKS